MESGVILCGALRKSRLFAFLQPFSMFPTTCLSFSGSFSSSTHAGRVGSLVSPAMAEPIVVAALRKGVVVRVTVWSSEMRWYAWYTSGSYELDRAQPELVAVENL